MARNIRISKWEKADTIAIAKINRDKKIAELERQIAELKKSPMIETSLSLQKVMSGKTFELKVLKGEESGS